MKLSLRPPLFCVLMSIVSAAFAATVSAQVGPDVITGHVANFDGLLQLGREGPIGSGIVGLGVSTTSCNPGDMDANWFQLPSTDHPMMLGNLYRLQTVDGSDRLEQLGGSWLKHGWGSSNDDECGLGCQDTGGIGPQLTVACSDTYAAVQFQPCGLFNLGQMAPRSIINPYTVRMEGGPALGAGGGCGLNYPSANHEGHNHVVNPNTGLEDSISHKIQVRDVDLMPDQNVGARYFVEGQYLSPHEFRDGNGNQYNNASHREVAVSAPDEFRVFAFTNLADTVAESPAIDVWAGEAQSILEPTPMADGRGRLGYQVTDLVHTAGNMFG